jgi:hypothetical protein
MAIRQNTEGTHGIFDDVLDFKQIMLNTYELHVTYRIVSELPLEAAPIHTQIRWRVN